jgi:hypothetical protein
MPKHHIIDYSPRMAVYNGLPASTVENTLRKIEALYAPYDQGVCAPEVLKPIMVEMRHEAWILFVALDAAIESWPKDSVAASEETRSRETRGR